MRALQNIALAAAGTLVGLAVTESVTRLTAPVDLYALSHQVVRVSENPVLMYEGRPDWHEHNAQGFRSEVDYSIEKRPGVVRIAVLGDSTTYGYGVDAEHAFPRRLEEMLAAPASRCGTLESPATRSSRSSSCSAPASCSTSRTSYCWRSA